ncbi:MAG: nif-specific transcriptional activator NifA [Oxalobacter sp.]|nr:MAG: nif-specific transcriptional activator NifA [Oxalobacter sp.]
MSPKDDENLGTSPSSSEIGKSPAQGTDEALRTIYEVSKLLSASLDINKVFRALLNLLSVNLGIWRGMVCLEGENGQLRLMGSTGIPAEHLRDVRYEIGEGITGRVFKTGAPAVIPDISGEPLFISKLGSVEESGGKNVAYIGVPIKANHSTIGVLSIMRVITDHTKNAFDKDVRLLTMIANLIGQTVRFNRSIIAERAQLLEEKQILVKALKRKYSLENVIGYSKPMQEVFAEVYQSAPGKSTVLLRGESGTGKEVIARAIHFLSPRKDGPFIKVNCAALSETLLESELFGHEKGAFTGAHAERKGRFELANGGTLFLDEIGDISPAFQVKLLRVLQEREFERVGGSKPIKVNVRLITATNRNLEEAVTNGSFRADLYYRINVFSIFIPPLRDRREDIPFLVEHFLDVFNRENRKQLRISPEAMKQFMQCSWPGNVRELENCIERSATMTSGDVIQDVHVLCQQNRCMGKILHFHLPNKESSEHVASANETIIPIKEIPQEKPAENPGNVPASASAALPAPPATMNERDKLIWAMEQCGWVQAKAARLLNLTPRQIAYALTKHNIEVKKF